MLNQKNFTSEKDDTVIDFKSMDIGENSFSDEQKSKIFDLITHYSEIWRSTDKVIKIPFKHKIKLSDDFKMGKCAVYRRNSNEHDIIKEEIEKMLQKGVIEECTSE